MFLIAALGRLKQEDGEFEGMLGSMTNPVSKPTTLGPALPSVQK